MKRFFCYILLFTATVAFSVEASPLRERIYVTTDKQLYLAGEPVLMKFVTTDSNLIPLSFSRVAYVELVNESESLIQMMVELNNGIGVGQMMLPVDLPTGYYRLIAYTNFMRNEGPDVFFEKNIAVVNTFLSENNRILSGTNEPTASQIIASDERGTVTLHTNAPVYSTRSTGVLTINGLPQNMHTLTVSIAGKDIIPVSHCGATLFRNNRMEQPIHFSGNYIPEYEGHIISGRVINNQTEELVTNIAHNVAPAIGFLGEGIRFFSGQTNDAGDVRFFTSDISGRSELTTVVFGVGERYRIDVQSPFVSQHINRSLPTFYIDSLYHNQLLDRSVALQVFRFFDNNPFDSQQLSDPLVRFEPSRVFPLDEFTRFTTMREVFIEFIPGARFRRTSAGNQEMQILTRRGSGLEFGNSTLVLLDGVPVIDHTAIFNYDPLLVETINLYYGPMILGGTRFDGIIEFITYDGQHQQLQLNRATQVVSYATPQKEGFFLAPDHSEERNRRSRVPDARHTLLWNTNIDTEGKETIEIPFFTSDLIGDFRVRVEGITTDGQFIESSLFFNVAE